MRTAVGPAIYWTLRGICEYDNNVTTRAHKFLQITAAVLVLQFVDDILDFTGSSSLLGKPALNDLASGIATAPVRPCEMHTSGL